MWPVNLKKFTSTGAATLKMFVMPPSIILRDFQLWRWNRKARSSLPVYWPNGEHNAADGAIRFDDVCLQCCLVCRRYLRGKRQGQQALLHACPSDQPIELTVVADRQSWCCHFPWNLFEGGECYIDHRQKSTKSVVLWLWRRLLCLSLICSLLKGLIICICVRSKPSCWSWLVHRRTSEFPAC